MWRRKEDRGGEEGEEEVFSIQNVPRDTRAGDGT